MTEFLSTYRFFAQCRVEPRLKIVGRPCSTSLTDTAITFANASICELKLVLLPPVDWNKSSKDFFEYFSLHKKNISLSYECKSMEGQDESRMLYKGVTKDYELNEVSPIGLEFITTTTIYIDDSSSLNTELDLNLILSYEIETYGQTSINAKNTGADEEEQHIRRLLEFDRFRPTSIPPRTCSLKIIVVEPLLITSQWVEQSPSNTMLTLHVQNNHPHDDIYVHDVALHNKECKKVASVTNRDFYNVQNRRIDTSDGSNVVNTDEFVLRLMKANATEIDISSLFSIQLVSTESTKQASPSLLCRSSINSFKFDIKPRSASFDQGDRILTYLHNSQLLGEFFTTFCIHWSTSSGNIDDGGAINSEGVMVPHVVKHECLWSVGTAWATDVTMGEDVKDSSKRTTMTPLKSTTNGIIETNVALSPVKCPEMRRDISPRKADPAKGTNGIQTTVSSRESPSDKNACITPSKIVAIGEKHLLLDDDAATPFNTSRIRSPFSTPRVSNQASPRFMNSTTSINTFSVLPSPAPVSKSMSISMSLQDYPMGGVETGQEGTFRLSIVGPHNVVIDEPFQLSVELMNCSPMYFQTVSLLFDTFESTLRDDGDDNGDSSIDNVEDIVDPEYIVYESETVTVDGIEPGMSWKQFIQVTPLVTGPLNLKHVYARDEYGNIYRFLQFYSVFVKQSVND